MTGDRYEVLERMMVVVETGQPAKLDDGLLGSMSDTNGRVKGLGSHLDHQTGERTGERHVAGVVWKGMFDLDGWVRIEGRKESTGVGGASVRLRPIWPMERSEQRRHRRMPPALGHPVSEELYRKRMNSDGIIGLELAPFVKKGPDPAVPTNIDSGRSTSVSNPSVRHVYREPMGPGSSSRLVAFRSILARPDANMMCGSKYQPGHLLRGLPHQLKRVSSVLLQALPSSPSCQHVFVYCSPPTSYLSSSYTLRNDATVFEPRPDRRPFGTSKYHHLPAVGLRRYQPDDDSGAISSAERRTGSYRPGRPRRRLQSS